MEFIIELLGEIILEFLFELLSAGISKFAIFVDEHGKVKKTIKYVLVFLFFGLSILLLVLSIIYKKKLFITISLIYMLLLIITNLVKFININILVRKKVNLLINIIKHLLYYSYPILLIVLSATKLENVNGKVSIIILSSLAIVAYFSVDMFRLSKINKKKRELEEKLTKEKEE